MNSANEIGPRASMARTMERVSSGLSSIICLLPDATGRLGGCVAGAGRLQPTPGLAGMAWGAAQSTRMEPRPAATVVVARDGREGVEVVVLRRAEDSPFAGGYVVFPGGVVDAGDAG